MLREGVCPAKRTHAPNWVAEHLGASSRRPRHPFPALMRGGNPWPCTCVHGPKKAFPSCHEGMLIPMPRSEGGTTQRWCDPLPNRVKTKAEAHPWATLPHDHGPPRRKVAVQIHLPLLTATLVCQLETRITVQKISHFSLRHWPSNLNRE